MAEATALAGAQVAVWRRLLTGDLSAPGPPIGAPEWAERLADLVGAPLVAEAAPDALDGDAVEHGQLAGRLLQDRQMKTVAMLVETNLEFLCMKGFANAHQFYSPAWVRTTGDLDVLVRNSDLQAAVGHLKQAGFRAVTLDLPPWGFLSEASYLPLVSPDAIVSVDLHVLPDCYPLYRGLSTEQVMARRRWLEVDGTRIPVAAPEHALLIAVANATKEKLGPSAIKSLLDCGRILTQVDTLDWSEVHDVAARAMLAVPLSATLRLVQRLGVDLPAVAENDLSALGSSAGSELERARCDFLEVFEQPFDWRAKLRRELLLTSEFTVALRRMRDRFVGLFSPRSGLPPGV